MAKGLCIVLTVVCTMVFKIYVAISWYPVSQAKLDRIRPEMTTAEVADFIGRPTRIIDDRHWLYTHFYCLVTVEVDFDSDGHFARWHLE